MFISRKIATLIIQLIVTNVVMIVIYMFFALVDYNGGWDGIFGIVLVQPIFAVIFSSLTSIACYIMGLPIRLLPKILEWWSTRLYLQLALLMIGLTLFVLSLIPQNMDQINISDDWETIKMIPNNLFAISGWFLTAFSLMHIFQIKRMGFKNMKT